MEKTRWIMRQWLESRKVAGLQINPDVTDTFAVEPELHWFFGTPIQPTVDQVVPTAHPVFGAAKSTIGQSQPLNLTYSMPNTAGTPDPFEAATRHSLPGLNPHHTPGVAGHNVDAGVSTNGLDQHPTTGSAPREALPTVSRVEVAKPNQLEMPKAKVNVMDADGQAAQAARATTAPLRPNMTSEVAKPDLAEPKSGLNPLSAPAAKVEHPNSLERILFGKSSPEASGQPLPAIADRVPATVEGPSIDADDTSKIPSLQESD